MQANHSSRDAIFDAALALFARQGYSVVSMREIAKESGIAVASIYNHFPSKRDILEAIYRFYDFNMERLYPDLDELLAMVPTAPPREVLRRTTFVYPDDIAERMNQATAIVVSLVQHDGEADNLMYKHLDKLCAEYDTPLLNKMMELDRIDPIDPGHFATLHGNYLLSAAVRHYTRHAIPTQEWLAGLDLLFQLVRERA